MARQGSTFTSNRGKTMLAFQIPGWQQPPELREVPIPEPGPGEVLIKVGGAGACHSDLHIMEHPPGLLPWGLPFTLGHENAGWVEELGPGVAGVEIGEAIAVYGPWGCGHCRPCRLSSENYCERQAGVTAGGGLGFDGGMAEYLLVPAARLLLPLGELDPRQSAPLGDAALTPYHAIKGALHKLVPGSVTVVIGVGGLGQMGVQILKAVSATKVIALDTSEEKLALAAHMGADVVIKADDPTAAEKVREAANALGADLVLDFVGADETLALAGGCARLETEVVLIGLAGGSFGFSAFAAPFGCSMSSTYWGSAVELMEVLALARAGKIRAEVEQFALADSAEVYARLRDGKIKGRAVICPNGF